MSGRLEPRLMPLTAPRPRAGPSLAAPSDLSDAASLPPDVRCILGVVQRHLYECGLTVSNVLSRCGVTNHNATSRFKLYVGVGIRRYIERQRLAAARRLLVRTDLRVYEIADAVGYAYVETFDRAFVRCVGLTPTAYREQSATDEGA